MNPRDIPIFDEAVTLRDRVSCDLEKMSFEQLQQFSEALDRAADGWTTLRRVELATRTLEANVLVSHWGLLRRRVSVEIAVCSDDGSIHPGIVPSVYFERFASGRIFKPGALGTVVIVGLALSLLTVAILLSLYVNRSN